MHAPRGMQEGLRAEHSADREPHATNAQGSAYAMRAWQCRGWTTHGFRTLQHLLTTTIRLPHVGGRCAPHPAHAPVGPGPHGGLGPRAGLPAEVCARQAAVVRHRGAWEWETAGVPLYSPTRERARRGET